MVQLQHSTAGMLSRECLCPYSVPSPVPSSGRVHLSSHRLRPFRSTRAPTSHRTQAASRSSQPQQSKLNQPDAVAFNRRTLLLSAAMAAAAYQCVQPYPAQAGVLMTAPGQSAGQSVQEDEVAAASGSAVRRTGRVAHSEEEWRRLLSRERYATLRLAVTERPYTSPLLTETRAGTFKCAGCGNPAFSSEAKFDASTGWPSFFQALPGAVMETNDFSGGMRRTEVRCSTCQGHFGHVFRDARLITGNEQLPTNLRYCMNGNALVFEAA